MLSKAYNDFGNYLQNSGYVDRAEVMYREAVTVNALNPFAWSNLGTCLTARGETEEALAAYSKAIELDPELPAAWSNISIIHADRGHGGKAIQALRKALELDPTFSVAHSNLICQLDLSTATEAELQAERKRWAAQHTAHIEHLELRPHNRDKVRIGYVSADIRNHSAAAGFGAMLTKFDRERFEVYAYYNNAYSDKKTEYFRGKVSVFRDVAHLTDKALAEQIRDDEIDILIDLSSHSAGNRLLTFAYKPAPVQITAWGYQTGTGLEEMDYIFSDPAYFPPEVRHLYAEKFIDMPCMFALEYEEEFPPIRSYRPGRPPTFGCYNRLSKITAETYRAWGRIMAACPEARILLKTVELDDESTRDAVIAQLKDVGIDQMRVCLMGKTSWSEHMDAYNESDVCIDPFPHGGGVTTLEGLMMGVPVIALRWPNLAGRVSSSLLASAGLHRWIAETEDEYVSLAVKNVKHGLESRRELRARMKGSILFDMRRYVAAVEAVYLKLAGKSL